ncbi:MAG: NifB/NifX family molybdenum-iron cluster-binding protein [Firmicutes bacterium]|nr:NifB/NifX family molybdenum-iron cluster-binding protein [Bacillota bacterium]
MKIAVTHDNGQVFQHFGHTKEFKIYEIEDGKIVSTEILGSGEFGHESLTVLLRSKGVELLICGGIGPGAQNALLQQGITFRGGCSGDADQQVENFIKGELIYNPNVTCNHHDHDHHHGEGHSCGHHHGDGHTCGHH